MSLNDSLLLLKVTLHSKTDNQEIMIVIDTDEIIQKELIHI